MSLKKQISKNVRILRKKEGLTQEELAEKARLNQFYVTRLETRPQNLTLDVIEKLAVALECSASDLFGEHTPSTITVSKKAISDMHEILKLLRAVKKIEKAADMLEDLQKDFEPQH